MRSVITKVVLASGVLLLFAGGTAQASTSTVVRANVPFAFTVNGKNFPAGEYRIERDDMSPSILLIRGEGRNHAHTLVSTRPDGGQDPAGSTPALTFKQSEKQCTLTSVWRSVSEGLDVISR